MAIDELQKPPGRWCVHRKPGAGCAIYGSHPSSCQSFSCQWLLSEDLPHRLRPDYAKVVLTADEVAGQRRLIANCDAANPFAWKRQPIYGWLKAQAIAYWGRGTIVMAKAADRLWLIGKSEDRDLGSTDPRCSMSVGFDDSGLFVVAISPPA